MPVVRIYPVLDDSPSIAKYIGNLRCRLTHQGKIYRPYPDGTTRVFFLAEEIPLIDAVNEDADVLDAYRIGEDAAEQVMVAQSGG